MNIKKHFLLTIALLLVSLLQGTIALATTSQKAADGAQPILYCGERVEKLYSLDYGTRTYHPITENEDMEKVISLWETMKESTLNAPVKTGFLLFTDKGKHTVYFSDKMNPDKTGRAVQGLAEQYNKKYPANIQWLAFLSTENIQRIQYHGMSGGNYTNLAGKYPKEFLVEVDTTNPESIAKISDYLKNIVVTETVGIYRGENQGNPSSAAGLYGMQIEFKGEVVYSIFGDFLVISTSDLGEQVVYNDDTSDQETSSQIKGLRDLMASLPEAQK